MNGLLWVALPGFCALVAGGLAYFIMESRMDVLLSKQQEDLAEARAALTAQKESLLESVRRAEESARGRAMDEFLAEIRREERQYKRDPKTPAADGKCLVRQERLFFRNIPLTNWIEQETPVEEEGADRDKVTRTRPALAGETVAGGVEDPAKSAISRLRCWTAQANPAKSNA